MGSAQRVAGPRGKARGALHKKRYNRNGSAIQKLTLATQKHDVAHCRSNTSPARKALVF